MAYTNGSAGSLTEILSALQAACTDNGWTLSGDVIHKGTCHVQVQVSGTNLQALAGTGIDGANALTTPAPYIVQLGKAFSGDAVVWPVSYEIHIHEDPDEVYLVVNHSVTCWQWMAFGCSPAAGLPGTGVWVGATHSSQNYSALAISAGGGGTVSNYNYGCGALFWQSWGSKTGSHCSMMHHGLDGGGWSGGSTDNLAVAASSIGTLTARQPNAWNGETALLPIQPLISRPSSKVSVVGSIGHARYVRNDNLADGEVITLGSDRWKTYPWYKKDASNRNGGNSVSHTGTFGWAVRYDGP